MGLFSSQERKKSVLSHKYFLLQLISIPFYCKENKPLKYFFDKKTKIVTW